MSEGENKIENLKFVVFDEWSYAPPAGRNVNYYTACNESFEVIAEITDEIISHLEEIVDEDDDEIPVLTDMDEFNAEAIQEWSWDNGGAGCSCVAYAEGKDIAAAAAEFYEEHLRDELEESDYDIHSEEMTDVEFTVKILVNKWEGDEVSVTVPASAEELKLIGFCAIEDEDINTYEGLEGLVKRVSTAALGEADDSWERTDEDEEFDNIDTSMCSLWNPIDTPYDIDEYDMYIGDCIVEYAKEYNEYDVAIEKLTDMVDMLVEAYNSSMW